MQSKDWSSLLLEMRADAAQIHDILDPRGLKPPYNGGSDPILEGQVVRGMVIRWDHGKDTVRSLERVCQHLRIVESTRVGDGPLTDKSLQAVCVTPDHMNPTPGV